MNHLTAWAITITAFSSGLYGIYKVIMSQIEIKIHYIPPYSISRNDVHMRVHMAEF